jgi:hypothetical protein
MIRVAWRQFRGQAVVAVGALVAVALFAAVTGPHLAHLYHLTVGHCTAPADCSSTVATFLRTDNTLRTWLGILVDVAPCIVGVFWGAPLVAAEIEAGTFRLAWTQAVTRTRWLAVKLAVIGVGSAAAVGLLSLVVTWWASPLDTAGVNRYGVFSQRGIVPVGYAVFAFVLGVTAGTVLRRTLPAMTSTAVGFLAFRLVTSSWLRPLFISPLHRDLALDPQSTGYGSSASGLSGLAVLLGKRPPSSLQPDTPNIPNGWIYSTRVVDRSGHGLTSKILNGDCPGIGTDSQGPTTGSSHSRAPAAVQQAMHDCVVKVGATFHEQVTYQPAGRYWAFQWYELAVFLGAALALALLCLWWVRHRLS